MNHSLLRALCRRAPFHGVLAAALSTSTVVFAASQDKEIEDYWKHISQIYERQKQAEQRQQEAPEPDRRFMQTETYPFEAFTDLEAREFVRGIQHGIIAAKRRHANKPPAYTRRQIESNIHDVLEFYPLVVQEPEGVDQLLWLLRKGDAIVQQYILEHCVPARRPGSMLSNYLQQEMLDRPGDFERIFEDRLTWKSIEADIAMLMMEALLHIEMTRFETFFQQDPQVASWTQRLGREVVPRDMLINEEIVLAEHNQRRFDALRNELKAVAELLAEQGKPEMNRPDPVKKKAADLLGTLYREVPFEDRQAVHTLLQDLEAAHS